ncbi:hypothetical protein ACFV98_12305 [Streptomyces violascens]
MGNPISNRPVRCDLFTRDGDGGEKLCAVAQGTVLSAVSTGPS